METNDTFISTLLEKEILLNKQIEAIRTTITLFQNGNPIEEHETSELKIEVPKTFEDAITWNSKILFALSKIQSGFVQDITDELMKHSKDVNSETLFKKITGLASILKKKNVLGAKQIGNKYKYFIK